MTCMRDRCTPAAQRGLRGSSEPEPRRVAQVERDPSKVTKVAPLPHMFVVKDLVVDSTSPSTPSCRSGRSRESSVEHLEGPSR